MTGDGKTAEQQCFAQYGLDDRILQTAPNGPTPVLAYLPPCATSVLNPFPADGGPSLTDGIAVMTQSGWNCCWDC